MSVRNIDRSVEDQTPPLFHRLAVLLSGLYAHLYGLGDTLAAAGLVSTGGIVNEHPADLASCLVVAALSNAITIGDYWPEGLLRRPHSILVTLYDMALSLLAADMALTYIWEPMQRYLTAVGELLVTLGLEAFGNYAKSSPGVEHLKLLIASFILYAELAYLEQPDLSQLFSYFDTDQNVMAASVIVSNSMGAGETYQDLSGYLDPDFEDDSSGEDLNG